MSAGAMALQSTLCLLSGSILHDRRHRGIHSADPDPLHDSSGYETDATVTRDRKDES